MTNRITSAVVEIPSAVNEIICILTHLNYAFTHDGPILSDILSVSMALDHVANSCDAYASHWHLSETIIVLSDKWNMLHDDCIDAFYATNELNRTLSDRFHSLKSDTLSALSRITIDI